MNDEKKDLLPAATPDETALAAASTAVSLIPWLGGAVSNVLSGMLLGRKMDRVAEVIQGLDSDLKEFKSEASEEYVKTEEFEELLEETLKRVAAERNEGKRVIFKNFLAGVVRRPSEPYDEKLRILRILEGLQPAHIEVMAATQRTPEGKVSSMGSPIQVMSSRLPNMTREGIIDLIGQLEDLRLIRLRERLVTMMTGRGAEDLRSSITDFGKRVLGYIQT